MEKIVRGAEASLTEAYLVVIGRFAKRDIRAVDSSTRSGLGTCLMAVLQQYMPGSLSQHLPLLGLIVITGQIVVTCPPSVLPSAEEPDEPSEGSEPDKKKRRGGFFGVS